MSLTIDYTPPPTGKKFMVDDSKMRVLMGPVGCLAGDTPVVTEFGLLPISQIDRPMRVLSWNEKLNRFQFSWCGGALPKGRGYLVRVSTPRGEFDAAEHHQIFCADHNYQQVGSLSPGRSVRLCLRDPLEYVAALTPSGSLTDAPRSTQTAVGFLDYYAKLARLRGQQLLMEEGIVQEFVPLPTDAQIRSTLSDLLVRAREDGLPEQLLEHTHQDQFFYQIQTDGFLNEAAPPLQVGEDLVGVELSGHNVGSDQQAQQSLLMNADRQLTQLSSECSRSYVTSCTNRAILSLERKQVKQLYWDLQVLDTNNYVTADGTIHHNSGKSVTCCFEIIRRASMQAPDATGKRRSRCAVVRETVRQLTDTTIKTFLDWFPDGVCGNFMRTTKTYYFKLGDVECEIMFRALDDADDVANLNSLELTFAWFNECRDIHPDIVDAMSKRIGRFPSKKDGGPTWHGMWADTNPPIMDSWWYYQMEKLDPKDGVSANDNGWSVFKQPSGRSAMAENVENLPDGYYDTKGRSEDYIRVYIDGEYGLSLAGKPVYKYFRPDYHMAKGPLKLISNGVRPLIVGMDLGLTPAAIIGQQDARGRVLVLAEAVSFDMGVQRFTKTVLKPLLYERFSGAPILVVVDPAGIQRAQTDERSAVDIIKAEGLKVIPAKTNNVSARLNAVDDFLMRQVDGESAFLVDPRCSHLKAAMMGGYRYHPKHESIEKNSHSHIAEALQYFMLGLTSSASADMLGRRREIKPVSAGGWT